MPDISFKIVPHPYRPGQEIVEIHSKATGGVVGMLYPQQGEIPGIKLVSVHMADKKFEEGFAGKVVDDDGSASFPHIPAIHVVFRPSSWFLSERGQVLKPADN